MVDDDHVATVGLNGIVFGELDVVPVDDDVSYGVCATIASKADAVAKAAKKIVGDRAPLSSDSNPFSTPGPSNRMGVGALQKIVFDI